MDVKKLRKLPMSDDEIIVSFRQAADPAAQVKVLAELNNIGKAEMRQRLRDLGLEVPAGRKAVGQKLKPEEAMDAYRSGMTDADMAAAFGVSLVTVQKWRERERLPSNSGPAGELLPDDTASNGIITAADLLTALSDVCAKYPDAPVFLDGRKPISLLLSALYDGPSAQVEVTLIEAV